MEGETNIFFSFLFFCSLLESRSPCNWNPRVTSIKANLLLSLGPLMSTSIKKKHKSTVWWHLNEYKFSPGRRSCVAGLFPADRLAREEKSNFGLQSRFSSRCWKFRRRSDDCFTSRSNGDLSKIPSVAVTIENEWTQDRFWIWSQSLCLKEEVLSNH